MEAKSMTDEQGVEICEKVSQRLIEELDSEDVWNKIEAMISDYLKSNMIDVNASGIVDKLEWSIKVTLTK